MIGRDTVFLHSLPAFLPYDARADQYIVLQGNIGVAQIPLRRSDVSCTRTKAPDHHNRLIVYRPHFASKIAGRIDDEFRQLLRRERDILQH